MKTPVIWGSMLGAMLLVFVAAQPAASQENSTVPTYNRLLAEMAAGKTQSACAEGEKLALARPDFAPVYNLLGLCASRGGDPGKAEKLFRKSLALDPSFTEARNNLAVNLLSRGKLKEGGEQLAEVIRQEPNNVNARFNLGRIKLGQGDAKGAAEHLRIAHRLRPDDPGIALALSGALAATGEKAESRSVLKGLSTQKLQPPLLFSAGILAADTGDYPMAEDLLGKAVSGRIEIRTQVVEAARRAVARGDNKKARTLLAAVEKWSQEDAEWQALYGYADYRSTDPQQALEHLRKAIELAPNVEDYYLKITEFLLYHNSDAAAAAFLRIGLQKLPGSAALHTSLALTGLARGMDAQMSVSELETALSLDPNYLPAWSLLGVAHLKLKQWDQLLDTGRRLAVNQPKSHEGYYFQGVALAEKATGDGVETRLANELLLKAIDLKPGFADAYLALGELQAKLGKTEESIASMKKAAGLDSRSPDIQYQLSRVLQRAGRSEEAQAALREYRRLHDLEQQKYAKSLFSVEK
jgi:tetratricopeptide (TPR) repeat protein